MTFTAMASLYGRKRPARIILLKKPILFYPDRSNIHDHHR